MFNRVLLAAALAVGLSGCVSPLVEPDRAEWQHKMNDARDWQEMAKRTVAAIPLASSGQSYNVYVEPGPTQFGDTYKEYLEEQLFARGFPVARSEDAADIVLAFEVKPLLYADKKRITDYNSLRGAVVAGLGQARNISRLDTGLAALVETGAVFDYLSALNGATNTEVVVISKIKSPRTRNFHFVRSETFYVPPTDFTMYLPPAPGLPELPVVPLHISNR
jgi:hypothetical protein